MGKRFRRMTVLELADSQQLSIERMLEIARLEGATDASDELGIDQIDGILSRIDDETDKTDERREGQVQPQTLAERLRQSEERVRQLEQELSKYKERVAKVTEYYESYKYWQSEAVKREAYKRAWEDQERRLGTSDQTIADLKGQLSRLRDAYEGLQNQVHTIERSNIELSDTARSLRLERDGLLGEKARLRSENNRLNDRIKELNERIARSGIAGSDSFSLGYLQRDSSASDLKRSLATQLHSHFERAATRVFESVDSPTMRGLNHMRAEQMKGLRFGDDQHPDCYGNEDVNALYCLRYEMGYAFEYYYAYSSLLAHLGSRPQGTPAGSIVDFVSVGSGQDLDLWGLLYALANSQNRAIQNLRVRWTGVDLVTWPNRVFDSRTVVPSIVHANADICKYLESLNGQMPSVLVFPKSIGELPQGVIRFICDWICKAKLSKPVHYLVMVHTDIRKMKGGPYQATSGSKDAVKAASIINAFATACSNNALQAHYSKAGYNDGHVENDVAKYQVRYMYQGRPSDLGYEYSCFTRHSGWFGDCYRQDPAFSSFAHGGKYVRVFDATNRLFECCKDWQSARLPMSADANRYASCNNARCRDIKTCPLQRYPRLRLDAMAYQIVYGLPVGAEIPVYYETEDEDIPF